MMGRRKAGACKAPTPEGVIDIRVFLLYTRLPVYLRETDHGTFYYKNRRDGVGLGDAGAGGMRTN